jgi:hypothetical protein
MAEQRRRVNDHWHVEFQTHEAQLRYEARMEKQLDEIRKELDVIANRMLLMMGGLGIVAFMLPIIAPFLRDLLGVEVPPSQTP